MGLRVVGKGGSIGCLIEAHNDPDPACRSCGLLCTCMSSYYPVMLMQSFRSAHSCWWEGITEACYSYRMRLSIISHLV